MTIELTSSFTVPAGKLQRMVALSPTFQAAVSAGGVIGSAVTVAEAQLSAVLKTMPGNTPRPYAVVALGMHHGYRLVSGGGQNYLRPYGTLCLYLTVDTDPNYLDDVVQAEIAAGNYLGKVVDDVVALANADDPDSTDGTGHLSIIGADLVDLQETPQAEWNSLGRFWFCTYDIGWGDGE